MSSGKDYLDMPIGIVDLSNEDLDFMPLSGQMGAPGVYGEQCDHSWSAYKGLFENYEYCTKCDVKKE